MGALRLYLKYLAISVRGQMQYRGSFLMMALGGLLMSATEFMVVWVLFGRFGSLKGWTLPEVALIYGIVHVSFALAEAFARGFDTFDRMIRTGDFDRILLRPRSTALQIAAREVQLMRVGRLLQGLAVMLWGAAASHIAWTPARAALLPASIIGGSCIFAGLFILQATLAFWTTESLEFVNIVTYGGVETAQYPLSIYRPTFRAFFTVVIPLAAINYLPAHALLGRAYPVPLLPWTAPLIGLAFLGVTLWVWNSGVRHYRSTGN